jgi:hypothetical protein
LVAVPADVGLVGNASFAHSVPVRVQSQAVAVDDKGGQSKHVDASDDNGGLCNHIQAGDDDRGGKGAGDDGSKDS